MAIPRQLSSALWRRHLPTTKRQSTHYILDKKLNTSRPKWTWMKFLRTQDHLNLTKRINWLMNWKSAFVNLKTSKFLPAHPSMRTQTPRTRSCWVWMKTCQWLPWTHPRWQALREQSSRLMRSVLPPWEIKSSLCQTNFHRRRKTLKRRNCWSNESRWRRGKHSGILNRLRCKILNYKKNWQSHKLMPNSSRKRIKTYPSSFLPCHRKLRFNWNRLLKRAKPRKS